MAVVTMLLVCVMPSEVVMLLIVCQRVKLIPDGCLSVGLAVNSESQTTSRVVNLRLLVRLTVRHILWIICIRGVYAI